MKLGCEVLLLLFYLSEKSSTHPLGRVLSWTLIRIGLFERQEDFFHLPGNEQTFADQPACTDPNRCAD
jgi:hypothetical protein